MSCDELIIGHADASLALRPRAGEPNVGGQFETWGFTATLSHEFLRAETFVWLGPDGIQRRLSDFLREMADEWRGWDNAKEWRSYEEGLDLSCTNDARGHISMRATLVETRSPAWQARCDITVDVGELDALAARAAKALY